MAAFGRLVAICLVGLLCAPTALGAPAEAAPAGEGPPAPRGDWTQQNATEVELKASGSTFSNLSFSISLPQNATINSASVVLEGKPVTGPLVSRDCDYSDPQGTGHKAYKGVTNSGSPGSKKPSGFTGDTFTSSEYSAVYASDDSRARQYAYYWNNEWGFHNFEFLMPVDITTEVSVEWEGFGGYYEYGYGYAGSCACYLWNNYTQSWETVGTGGPGTSDVSLSRTFSGNYYLRETAGKKFINVLAMCTGGQYYYSIYTDYIRLSAKGNVQTFPKNPAMDVGGNGLMEWNYATEKFDFMVEVGDVALMNEIQKYVRNPSPTQNINVKVKFVAQSIGKIKVSKFTVSFSAPPWCNGVPDTFSLDEDTDAPKLIELNRYFTDPDVKGNPQLAYEVIYEEDAKKLDADVDSLGFLSFKTPLNNWWGSVKFKVRAWDSDAMERESNLFKVTVNPINDPPVITPVGRQLGIQNLAYALTVKVRDVDLDLDVEETVIFSDNSNLFDIGPEDGKIAFTPRQDQVGIYNVQITATDRDGAQDWENYTLEIQDAEDVPVLEGISDQTATEDQPFTYNVIAADPDLPYGDTLTFSDNTGLFEIDHATGTIYFVPQSKDIGSHKVKVTVTDSHGESDWKEFTLNILNSMGTMNRPPSIEVIANQTAVEGTFFELQVKATDPDLLIGDSLTYSDSCPVFDLNSNTGKISFKPTVKDAGSYNVKITVRDREGLTATTEFRFTVYKMNHPPSVTGITPKDGTKVTQNKRITLAVVASDPDGDRLNISWRDGDNVLGYGPNITIAFEDTGTYILTIVVTDGKLEMVNETSIEVVEPGSGGKASQSTPGFELVAVFIAALVAVLWYSDRRRR